MSLNKKKMVREIGRRTRLKNREVQAVLEALIDVWIEALAENQRIELENVFVLLVRESGHFNTKISDDTMPQHQVSRRLVVRTGKRLRIMLNESG